MSLKLGNVAMKSEFYGTEIFLDNEYTREYLDICRASLSRPEPSYFEEHQIIPSGYWALLPGAAKGKLPDAMPVEKRVFCKLTPEEHYRCHYLLTQMFSKDSKDYQAAIWDLKRRNAETPEQYGETQKLRNKNRDWRNRPEHEKYR